MAKTPTSTPHVLFVGSDARLAEVVKLWLTRGEGMRVDVVSGIPTRRTQFPRRSDDISVVVSPQKGWSRQFQELLNASLFPGVPVVLLWDQEKDLSRESSRRVSRGVEVGGQTFPFRVRSSSMERLPHLIRELHEMSQKRRIDWFESQSQPTELSEDLGEQELEVLALVARGYSNAAISDDLRVSEKSVEARITSIYEKLSLQNDSNQLNLRVAAALYFYGLVPAGGITARRG